MRSMFITAHHLPVLRHRRNKINRMDIDSERSDIDFDVAKSLRYHSYRRSFWDSWVKLTNVLAIMSGTAVLVSIMGDNTKWAKAMGAFVAFIGAADIVFGFSERARDHDGLYREFSRLAQDIAGTIEPTEAQIYAWKRQRLAIEMEEPGVVGLLERRCAREECLARGLILQPPWKLSWFQILFAQFAFWPSTGPDNPTPL